MAQKKYKVLSLFSGAMGLDIGLEETGRFKIIACVEKEPSFCATIRANKRAGKLSRDLVLFEKPIEELDPIEVITRLGLKPGELDLIAGGPPCQSFSTSGKRRTTQDPRGTLLWQYLRFVEAIRPKFFLMENVRGLLSAALKHRPISKRPDRGGPPLKPDELPGSVVRQFAEDLHKIDGASYHMDCFEVNSVNYGAPQIRERAIFIGNRYNVEIDFPDPTHGSPSVQLDPQKTLFIPTFSQISAWKTLRDAIGDLREDSPEILDFSARKKHFLSMVSPGSNWRSLPREAQEESMGTALSAKGGRSGWWRRLSFDLPCPTLLTMPNHAGTALCHPTEVRALSLREYARIQEFPDDWIFCGTIAEKYAQVGNAVPVRLGRIAGDAILNKLDFLKHAKWEPCQSKPEAFRIVYVQSHVRTRQWYKNGKTLIWSDGAVTGNANYAAPKTKRKFSLI